jgi:hypothetical protein
MDVRNVKGVTKEVRAFAKTDDALRNHEAFALIVGSTLLRLRASFFLGINKPKIPIKLFEDKVTAKKWLLDSFIKNV